MGRNKKRKIKAEAKNKKLLLKLKKQEKPIHYSKEITVVKQSIRTNRKLRRDYKQRHWKEVFIFFLLINSLINKEEIDCSLHHKKPTSIGGKNELANFMLLNEGNHDWLHDNILNPQVEDMYPKEKRKIIVPNFDNVYHLNSSNFEMFIERFINEANFKHL